MTHSILEPCTTAEFYRSNAATKLLMFCMIGYSGVLVGLQDGANVYLHFTPDFKCNRTTEVMTTDDCGRVVTASCGSDQHCPTGYIYNASEYESTVVTDFDLVCSNAYIVDWIMMTILVGAVGGSLAGGYRQLW